MTIKIFDDEQGSEGWYRSRLGVPSASRFADILAKGEGKMRRRYMLDLAAERVTGIITEGYSNSHIARGSEQEDEARKAYALLTDNDPQPVGFIYNGLAGASPDSLLGSMGGLEIKTALGAIQIERLLRGSMPPEHRAQVQGGLWVSEREYWDFVSYSPKMPLLVVTVPRDEAYIADLELGVKIFTEELEVLVETIKRYGGESSLKDQLKSSLEQGGK